MGIIGKILGALSLSAFSAIAWGGQTGSVATGIDEVFGLPKPPVDFAYNFKWALTDSIASLILAFIVIGFAISHARRRGTYFPVVVACSGLLFGIPEVLIDIAGACWWAVGPDQVVFTIMGRPMTWLPMASWFAFAALLIYIPYHLLVKKVSTKALWIGFAVTCLVDPVFEEINLRIPGLYTYYGHQPLVFSVFPVWWMFVNAAGCFVAAALIYRFEKQLSGWKSIAVFFLAPLAYMAAFGFSGVPAAIVINGDYSWLATQLGGLITVALAIVSVALTMSVVLDRNPFPFIKGQRIISPA
ncbi:TPA: hypothetical protein L4Q76_001762 [Pseudomonas aeruginosa]|uniref:hypothetical protein n=1 Tax=Pseudomonas aeruginosa TaxID=287 RepID=UPI0003B95178|nr:hypothetical protein [Pseudomonas aeruginosa]ERY35696.1 hypothetical protein Q067_02331 [Pseudomonas aeruginosa BL13]MBH4028547.1 hypothetical protein [Pseudomonas aeruginosa]MBV5530483.1 hypothetical protein [Pseudomonas aeruginosa]MCS8095472.1 hypothetical protein [Pseudomonas aeruginosa]RTS98564.1 hypothetical protein DY952_10615 [Pseudomonas aeruginosa]